MSMLVRRIAAFSVLLCLVLATFGLLRLRGETALTAAAPAVVPASTDNWGLSFPTEGESPVGNASVADLAQYDAY